MNRTQFINLIKQYWKSNPELTFQDIIYLFLEIGQNEFRILSEDEAKVKIEKLCKESSDIDNFIDKLI